MKRFLVLAGLALAGCGSVPPTEPEVEVMATVTKGGKPVSDVVINFQPTGLGLPKFIDVKDGQFLTTLVPGTYTYYFTAGKDKAAFEEIPKGYREGSMDRQIEVKTGNLDLKID